MKTVYLIRHGQTESNLHKIVGSAQDPLSELGKKQAVMLAERIRQEKNLEIILCSPYTRAMETASAIQEVTGLPIEYSELLIESTSPKEIEGMPRNNSEVDRIRGILRDNWGNKNWQYSIEENFYRLQSRADAALTMLERRRESTIVVVSHGAFMKMVAEVVLLGTNLNPELSTSIYDSLALSNAGVTVLQLQDDGKWIMVRWNDTVHLEPLTESY